MLVGSLFADGLLADSQKHARDLYHPSSFHMMTYSSGFACIVSLIYGLINGELAPFIEFISTHSDIVKDLSAICVLGAIGQVLIFYTIKHFGPLILAFATTTRKLITIVSSILLHGHSVHF